MSRMPASAGLDARQMLELSLYDYIGTLLERLIPRFDLQGSVERIRRSYQLICRESLAIPCGLRSLNFSRINQDGTPFQFSSCLGDFKPPLQFLSEAGVPGSAGRDRQLLSKGRIAALASLFGAETPLFEVTELLDDMAFGNHPELLLESGGPLWICVS